MTDETKNTTEKDALRAMADHVVMLPIAAVLAGWRDGDERGWQAEFDMLRSERTSRIDMLASSIQQDGIRLPILLGSDGRVWDGHHRLCAADLLALETVPCEFADPAAVVMLRQPPQTKHYTRYWPDGTYCPAGREHVSWTQITTTADLQLVEGAGTEGPITWCGCGVFGFVGVDPTFSPGPVNS